MKWKIIFLLGCTLCLFNLKSKAQWQTSGSDLYYNAGNVGIGTASPVTILDINKEGIDGQIIPLLQLHNTYLGGRQTGTSIDFRHQSTTGVQRISARIAAVNEASYAGFYNNDTGLAFYTMEGADLGERVRIDAEGNVGIGTTSPTVKLAVNGTTKAKEVIVTEQSSDWPDYVFDAGYQMPDLNELETFISEYRHLPSIPGKDEVQRNGQHLGTLQIKLLQKIEKLTLLTIKQQKEIEQLKQEMQKLLNH